MRIKTIAMGAAVAALTATPVLADAPVARVAAPIDGEQEFAGRSMVIAVIAAAAIVAGIVFILDDDEDDPISV